MSRLRAALHAVLIASFVCACGGGDDGTERWPRRVELDYDGPPRPEGRTHVVSDLRVPADVAPWVIEKSTYELAPIPGAADSAPKGLLFHANETKVIIPGPFDPALFNHVAVTFVSRLRGGLTVRLRRGGRPVVMAREVLIKDDIPLQRIEVPFPRNRREREVYDDLVLHVRRAPILLRSVELVHKPLALWVPDPSDGPGPAAVGGDVRPAIALSTEGRLRGRLDPRPGDVLELSYAPVEETRLPAEESTLVVGLTAGDWTDSFELPVAQRGRREPRWFQHRHSLEGVPRGDLTVELRLESGNRGAFAWVGQVTLFEPLADPPTVLLVTSDTHRGDHVGLSGLGVDVETPNLDALARRGVLFEQCQSSSNLTLPSHVALMTGRHPRDTGVANDNRMGVTEEARTLAEIFRENGYRTHAAVSALHLGDRISGLGQGFDRMSAPLIGQRRAVHTLDVVTDWVGEAEGQPVFVWLHCFDAHAPYREDGETQAYLDERERLAGATLDDAVQRLQDLYRGEVTYLDGQLGRLLELPRFREGIVAVTADHGESLGRHGVLFEHQELFPDTLHVPLILAWPGAPANARVRARVRQIDLGRTLLDLAGLEDQEFPGDDLSRHLGDTVEPRPIFALSSLGSSASITSDRWHLILHLREHEIGYPEPVRTAALHEVELFDLVEDPGCDEDLSESRADVARRLRTRLVEWLGEARDLGWSREAELSERDVADLAALGYADGAPPSGVLRIDPDCDCERCERFR